LGWTDLTDVLGRDIGDLSGGELQRFAIAMSCIQKADMCARRPARVDQSGARATLMDGAGGYGSVMGTQLHV
jgi:ABC-type phosphate/phosphonate transport system ATPase subunit